MQKNSQKQLRNLYCITGIGTLQIAGASWVALLAMRGFSLLEIGMMESIFHIVSLICEIPSGAVADTFGRKKTMILSLIMSIVSSLCMILSGGFASTAFAIGISALSYNLSSGTREALAYDSLKQDGQEQDYDLFDSRDMMLYRISSSSATLCAGLALTIGYRLGYAIDIAVTLVSLFFAFDLYEVPASAAKVHSSVAAQFSTCIRDSIWLVKSSRRMRRLVLFNAVIGSFATLMVFFLQARLPEAGIPSALLGPALFFMGLGAAAGARIVSFFSKVRYRTIGTISLIGILFSALTFFSGRPYLMCLGGFLAGFFDDFLEVRSDITLNSMIPSERRATLISVSSCTFSVVMIALSTVMGWMIS